MKIEDEKLKELNALKVELMKKLDKKEITEEKYKESMVMISQMSMEIIKGFISEDKQKQEVKEAQPMAEAKTEVVKNEIKPLPKVEKVEKVKKVKTEKVKKEKKPTTVDLILKAMQMKTVNSPEKVAAKVVEWDNTLNVKKVEGYTKWLIGRIEKKIPRFAKYTFDKEKFELVYKE